VDAASPRYANRAAFAGFDRVLTVEQLGMPDVLPWLFRHDRVEACTAVQRPMLRHLLALGADTVVYFAPDIAVFHPLAALAERLETASILLTPPQTGPDGGFLAVRNDAAGRTFADCDAPDAELFERVAVVRDPGWGVASLKRLAFTPAGGIAVDGSPLVFCRFSDVGDASEPHELRRWYERRVTAHTEPGIPPGFWHFASFSDGTPIPRAARLLARARPDLMARFADPFDASGDSFAKWLAAEAPG